MGREPRNFLAPRHWPVLPRRLPPCPALCSRRSSFRSANWTFGADSEPVAGPRPGSSPKRSTSRATSPPDLDRRAQHAHPCAGRGATVRITVNVDAGGRRFETAPQTVQHGYYGEKPEQQVEVKDLGPATLTVDGRDYSVRSREASFQAGGQKTVTKALPMRCPSTVCVEAADASHRPHESRRGTARDRRSAGRRHAIPRRIGNQAGVLRALTQKTAQGSTVTVDVTSVEVPGGLVNRTVKELDSQGHLVRRRTVELVDFKTVDDDDVPQWHSRRWRRRHQRQMDYAP